jgi:hypothetical protein
LLLGCTGKICVRVSLKKSLVVKTCSFETYPENKGLQSLNYDNLTQDSAVQHFIGQVSHRLGCFRGDDRERMRANFERKPLNCTLPNKII